VTFVLPAHRNPVVREAILPEIEGRENVLVTEPLAYGEFTHLLSVATVVLTDSGGVQEEAPSLGKPVLVMRENTERPEAVTAGTVRLIGTDEEVVVTEVTRLLTDDSAYT
ncbi:UDP-N-acetylglucosamine 2-epimerase (non-hydrolyzing), partial [Xanthomonas citri pv. citri]|nr:UDP-N-acetylglucosamine 2-epimerase (non-hydrolyzing) [Xanthomonas citri pv. citri]